MKVVIVLAPGALALKQTDKMEKPIKWIPPPTMYQKLPEIPHCSIIVELPEIRRQLSQLSKSQPVRFVSIIVSC